MSKPRFFTGIQATGTLTLGNYCGLIHHILKIQEEYEVIIMIGDFHALTIPRKDIDYQKKSQEIAALLYACGLKEENCKIFIQSQVKEHLELAFFLSPHITVGILANMTQYKTKKKEKETGNLALLSYPILMAADIFLYEADLVIVGQDQKQHLELATDIAQKFNNFHEKKLLKLPKFVIPEFGAKIMGLEKPENKMSKSENDYIGLLDTPKVVAEKFKKAKTDSDKNNAIYYDPKDENKKWAANLLTICALFQDKEISEVVEEMNKLNYSDFKEKVAKIVNKKLKTIQKSYQEYLPKISGILEKNKDYLKHLAEAKIKKIKEKLKIL